MQRAALDLPDQRYAAHWKAGESDMLGRAAPTSPASFPMPLSMLRSLPLMDTRPLHLARLGSCTPRPIQLSAEVRNGLKNQWFRMVLRHVISDKRRRLFQM